MSKVRVDWEIDEKLKQTLEDRAKRLDVRVDDYAEGILYGFLDFMHKLPTSELGRAQVNEEPDSKVC